MLEEHYFSKVFISKFDLNIFTSLQATLNIY